LRRKGDSVANSHIDPANKYLITYRNLDAYTNQYPDPALDYLNQSLRMQQSRALLPALFSSQSVNSSLPPGPIPQRLPLGLILEAVLDSMPVMHLVEAFRFDEYLPYI